MPHADVACSSDILTVEREEHGRGGRAKRDLGFGHFSQRQGRVIVQPRPTAWVMNREAIPGLKGRYKSSVPDITLVVDD